MLHHLKIPRHKFQLPLESVANMTSLCLPYWQRSRLLFMESLQDEAKQRRKFKYKVSLISYDNCLFCFDIITQHSSTTLNTFLHF